MSSTTAAAAAARKLPGPSRLLSRARDDKLVGLVRHGDAAAFEALFERYAGPILSYCQHMLGSREDAEDAVQQTFVSAHRDLLRSDRPIALKPWLYTIARNRCLSALRARRPESVPLDEGLAATFDLQVEQRVELSELLEDMGDLPEDQRTALVLFELDDLSQEQIGHVLGCEARQVKGLVFRARMGLSARREGRRAPCEHIREELATARRGASLRNRLRHHLRTCSSCAAFRDEVRRQRSLMAVTLPAVPSAGLKAAVLGAVGAGSGTGGGTAAVGAVGGLSGLLGLGSVGSGTVAKLVLGAALVGGAGAAGATIEKRGDERAARSSSERLPATARPVAAEALIDSVARAARGSSRAATQSAATAGGSLPRSAHEKRPRAGGPAGRASPKRSS